MNSKHLLRFSAAVVSFSLITANAQISTANREMCVVSVSTPDSGLGVVSNVVDTPVGVLVAASSGLYRFDGLNVFPAPNSEAISSGGVSSIWVTQSGILIAAGAGLYRYDGSKAIFIVGSQLLDVQPGGNDVQDTAYGVLVNAGFKVFRYDGVKLIPIPGDFRIGHTKNTVLAFNQRGLFQFNGAAFTAVPGGSSLGTIYQIEDTRFGTLIAADKGIFQFRNGSLASIAPSPAYSLWDTKIGVLIKNLSSILLYDGSRVISLAENVSGHIDLLDTNTGLFVFPEWGAAFRSDGQSTKVLDVSPFRSGYFPTRSGVLLRSPKGLSLYESSGPTPILGGGAVRAAQISGWDTSLGTFLDTDDGDYVLVDNALPSISVSLDNIKEIDGSTLTRTGLPTRWTINDRCAEFAGDLGLGIVPRSEAGEGPVTPAVAGRHGRDQIWLTANIPIKKPGKWSFQIVSQTFHGAVGQPSRPVSISSSGFREIVAEWWRTIVVTSTSILVLFNLVTLSCARYSSAAWRLATDKAWGNSILLPQRLLISHSRTAQLWLLDLYVRGMRSRRGLEPVPFLAFPLSDGKGNTLDTETVLARFGSSRHIWLQGKAGMGKSTAFMHLRDTYFSCSQKNSFEYFRKFRYVLVPIEARRFAGAVSAPEKDPTSWLISCVRTVLSEGGLRFDDVELLAAVMKEGTLGIALDGLNEVDRRASVNAFAADFPDTPLFVTSQEMGEPPFEVWRLPQTIGDELDGLLRLYLGEQAGAGLGERLRASGLIGQLHTGYDVRLIIELERTRSDGSDFPENRLDLYESAVRVGWPDGDDRRDLLEAAAWKLLTERGPNEDRRFLVAGRDAPADLLTQLEAVRERSARSIRLIRQSPLGYEFVHDQMNSYLAACWFVKRPTITIMKDVLSSTKIWYEQRETQHSLWEFVAEMRELDFDTLQKLWIFAGEDDRRTLLAVALVQRAEREGWTLTRRPGATAPNLEESKALDSRP